MTRSIARATAANIGLGYTALGTLATALTWPVGLLALADVIDNPWSRSSGVDHVGVDHAEFNIFAPIPFTLRFALQSERLGLIHAIGNPFNASPWTVFGDTWTPVAAADIGNRKNSQGTGILGQLPADQVLLDGVFNFEMVNDVPPNAPAGVVFAASLKGCTFAGQVQQVVEQDQVFVEIPCACYGEIDATITAYTTGNEST